MAEGSGGGGMSRERYGQGSLESIEGKSSRGGKDATSTITDKYAPQYNRKKTTTFSTDMLT